MPDGNPVFFLSVAEVSGDNHAAALIRSIRSRVPGATFVGAAGPAMQKEGCKSIVDLTASASMLGNVFSKIFYYRRVIKQLQASIREIRPDVFVPVDSPALNWHLAKAARSASVPIVHYIAPQVWAWAPWRIRKLRKLTDHVACLFPFEERYFQDRGVPATFVGHPRFDSPVQRREPSDPTLQEAWVDGNWKIALLPGSREGEIFSIAPAMSVVSDAVAARWPEAQCTFIAADDLAAERIGKATGRDDLCVSTGNFEEVLSESHFAIVASGTASLEVASLGVPMAVVYNISRWQKVVWSLIVRRLVRTRHLSLPNILSGRRIVPELMPWFKSPDQIVDLVFKLLGDYGWLFATRNKLHDLTASLHIEGSTSSEKAAELIIGKANI